MGTGYRLAAACLLLVLAAGFIPASEPQRVVGGPTVTSQAQLSPAVAEAIQAAGERGETALELEVLVALPDDLEKVRRYVRDSGGEVISEDRVYARVKLPPAAAESLPKSTPALAIGVNETRTLDLSVPVSTFGPVDTASAVRLAAPNFEAIGLPDFRAARDAVEGRGILVAVVDTGVDVSHPALRLTSDGQPKVVEWKDFTAEGQVLTPHPVEWAETYQDPEGRVYRLPAPPPGGTRARFGQWHEYTVVGEVVKQDLDDNGSILDSFGLLVVDSTGQGLFDTVYLDSNRNLDFRDEVPLKVYSAGRQFAQIGAFRSGRQSLRRLSVVVSDIDPDGTWVSMGFDGTGHGTQVAGVLSGNEPLGYQGVAPGAQIMALKAIASTGQGSWSSISSAIKYAADRGAAVINVSLAGLASASADVDNFASERLNQIARDHNVLIVVAAGNNGPGLSSGATVGHPLEVISVGAYYTPAMYKRDFGYVVPSEGVWLNSGMGPRSDGANLPSLIAPGGSPAPSPLRFDESGYVLRQGTSIATPHVSGAAALLMEAGRLEGLQADRISVKRAIELGASPILDLGTHEQGYGRLLLTKAYDMLQQMNSLPAVRVRTPDGGGGMLARSFRPGTGEFSVRNLSPQLARIKVTTSEPWVRSPYDSLTVPFNLERRLPLQLTPPAERGIHSAFVVLKKPEEFGPSATIPITYVNPYEFEPSKNYSISEAKTRLEVGRFQRYFLHVRPGTAALTVNLHALPGLAGSAQGTVQMHVFRPDGQGVFKSADVGARGIGLSALYRTADPLPGVWEVVVYAVPDQDGVHLNAGYTMEANIQPGSFAGMPLQLIQPAGSTMDHTIRVTNSHEAFTGRVESMGVTRTDLSTPWRVIRKLNIVDEFTLTEFAQYLRVEINDALPSNYDLDLQLYRFDSGINNFVLVSQSATRGSSREVIEIAAASTGRYQVAVRANGPVHPFQQYQYRRLSAADNFNVIVSDTARRHITGETWAVPIRIIAPSAPGRYKGYVALRDTERRQNLELVPFELSVGQPRLSVEALPADLVLNRPSNVVLEVRNSATGRLVDVPLTVNGQRFEPIGGRVTIPVTPFGSTFALLVLANAREYQFVNQEVVLPVHQSPQTHPVGIGLLEDLVQWRKKVTSQMP